MQSAKSEWRARVEGREVSMEWELGQKCYRINFYAIRSLTLCRWIGQQSIWSCSSCHWIGQHFIWSCSSCYWIGQYSIRSCSPCHCVEHNSIGPCILMSLDHTYLIGSAVNCANFPRRFSGSVKDGGPGTGSTSNGTRTDRKQHKNSTTRCYKPT